jgi:hypothetical protein
MNFIDRHVAVLKPKQGYLDWMLGLPDAEKGLIPDLEVARSEDCMAFLVPEFDTNEDALEFFYKQSKHILEIMCGAWDTREELWPKKRDRRLLKEWFDVEIHSEVIDLVNRPVEKEFY